MKNQRINFLTLYKKFELKVVKHFFFSTIRIILSSILLDIISNLFQKGEIRSSSEFKELLPTRLQKVIGSVSKARFIIGSLLLVSFYALIYYFDDLWEGELRIRGGHYSKNFLLDKFRRLPFEEKKRRQNEINNLVEIDAGTVGYYWEHLLNHTFHSFLSIIATLYFSWGKFVIMTEKQIFFSLIWLILLNVINYFFTKIVLRNEQRYKKKLTKEWSVINKEKSNIIVIEGMGLTSQYRDRQKKVTNSNEKLLLNFNYTKSLSKTIPGKWLMEIFPFLLLFLSREKFIGIVLINFWNIFRNFADIFYCLWDYADYASSRDRINNFLILEEKNDNLLGTKPALNSAIKKIEFQNVSFRFRGQLENKTKSQEEWVLYNYNHLFLPERTNYLLGANGSGKSTILYLLLGMLTPQEGKIIIETEKGEKYNLHQEINLYFWRKNNVVYCAHDNLVEEGSTGQKQLANINDTLKKKENAQIFLFDEADNALDEAHQQKFTEKIKQLVEKKKIVIYVKH